MIQSILSFYQLSYSRTVVYMLQSTEYQVLPYLRWYWRTSDFSQVAKRRSLEATEAARLLLRALQIGMLLQIILGFWLIILGMTNHLTGGLQFGLAALVSYPIVWAHLITLPLLAGRWFIVKPRERRLIKHSHGVFEQHKAVRIAVAGSYGKTTMKELLLTVLSEGKNVAATPANKNVAVSHAAFAKQLGGDEEVLIIEYGESKPGDVSRFAETTKPTIGIITGVAPAHLDHYKTVAAVGKDIFSLAAYLQDENLYVNGESPAARPFIKPKHHQYNAKGVLGWKVSDISVTIEGISFILKKTGRRFTLQSKLLGRHQIGPLALAVALADQLGLSQAQIEAGVAKTVSFEHRMQPYRQGGAWVIDDTYNGNIEGMKTGLALLQELDFRRKIYITPGLVDQGKLTKQIHVELGETIAAAQPDKVVLMHNSVTEHIKEGISKGDYKGEILVENNPLKFYSNLDQFLATGDVVLMQNDWTDNYN